LAKKRIGSAFVALAATGIIVCLMVLGLPNIIAYHHLVNSEPAITVYKTPEQWIAENPDAAKNLTYWELGEISHITNGSIFHLNERIDAVSTHTPAWPGIRRFETRIVDRKTGALLVKSVSFTMGDCGNSMPLVFWLHECDPPNHIASYLDRYQKIGRKIGDVFPNNSRP
jgi:hypothetical protein